MINKALHFGAAALFGLMWLTTGSLLWAANPPAGPTGNADGLIKTISATAAARAPPGAVVPPLAAAAPGALDPATSWLLFSGFCAISLIQLAGISAGLWRFFATARKNRELVEKPHSVETPVELETRRWKDPSRKQPHFRAMNVPVTLSLVLCAGLTIIALLMGIAAPDTVSPDAPMAKDIIAFIRYGAVSIGLFGVLTLVWSRNAYRGQTADMIVFLVLAALNLTLFGLSFVSDTTTVITVYQLDLTAPLMLYVRTTLEGLALLGSIVVVVTTITALRNRGAPVGTPANELPGAQDDPRNLRQKRYTVIADLQRGDSIETVASYLVAEGWDQQEAISFVTGIRDEQAAKG
jgi:hypothetical protein